MDCESMASHGISARPRATALVLLLGLPACGGGLPGEPSLDAGGDAEVRGSDAARPPVDLAPPPAAAASPADDAATDPGDVANAPADLAQTAPADLAMAQADLAMAHPADLAMAPHDIASADAAKCGPVTTAGIECNYAHNAYNASPSVKANSTVAWSCSPNQRAMTSNGLPDHDVGTFPNVNCPNTISAQAVSATMTLAPAVANQLTKIGIVGYAFNGVKFDPSTAGTCSVVNGQTSCSLIGMNGTWNIEALGQKSFDFGVDSSNAHVQPTGEYHYHGMPNGLIAERGKGQALTLVGFALDGFPVYARYGYKDPNNAQSGVKTLAASYRVKAQPDPNRPSVNTYPMGAFTQDYEYVANLGDLDECNGRTGVTPEFPCGIYHYYITDTWPFIQRCVKGTPSGGGGMGPKACANNADCVGACPPQAKGCGCGATPMGKLCVPTCALDADCPVGPMGALFCRGGYCLP